MRRRPGAVLAVLVAAALAVVALSGFAPRGAGASFTLQLQLSGPSDGQVFGPGGICKWVGGQQSGSCTFSVEESTSPLAISAQPSPGASVTWDGCSSATGVSCYVERNPAPALVVIKAAFSTAGHLVTVNTTPGGGVTGTGISCGLGGTDCSETLSGQQTFTATPMAGYQFVRWEGPCANVTTTVCTTTITAPTTIGAVFSQTGSATTSITILPPAGGKVTGAGINCGLGGADCFETVPVNTQVELTATPMQGYRFGHWEGACANRKSAVCTILVDRPTVVGVAFVKVVPRCQCHRLTVVAARREFGTAEGSKGGSTLTRFFFSLDWTLSCTAGTGQDCRGAFRFTRPAGFRNVKMWRVEHRNGKTIRTAVTSPVTCENDCRANQSTIRHGTVRVNMDSARTLAVLAGTDVEFRVTTTCKGDETTYVFVVSIGANGRVTAVKRLVEV